MTTPDLERRLREAAELYGIANQFVADLLIEAALALSSARAAGREEVTKILEDFVLELTLTPRTVAKYQRAIAKLRALASQPSPSEHEKLKRCTICGFIVDTSYAAEKPSIDFSTRGRHRTGATLSRKVVADAMQSAWDTICSDTGCHPLDITHRGRKLFFHPAHWAEQVAALLDAPPSPRAAEGG